MQDDTVICTINSPNNNIISKCNLNLIVPYYKPIVVKNTNGGVYFSNLDSDLYIEMNIYDCAIYHHNGSLEAHSTSGKIDGSISIPQNGHCICYSISGDIHLEIPMNSSLNIHLKTDSGTITFTNLNIDITSSSTTELKGSLNGIEGDLYLESKTGNIILKGI